MLKGDLGCTPLDEVLRQLAAGAATGCLHVVDGAGKTARVYLRGGRVYAVVAPGRRPQLSAVEQPVVEDFLTEQVRASLSDLLPWRHATWRFHVNERTRESVAPLVEVETLLAEIASRKGLWRGIEQTVQGPDAVPLLSAAGTASGETAIDADAWTLLCKVDGTRTVTELARECGVTLHEAGRVVVTLVQAGLLEIEEVEPVVEADEPVPLSPREAASRLAAALGGLGAPAHREEPVCGLELPAHDEVVTGSISRMSEALSAMLGPATASDDVFGAPAHRPTVPAAPPEHGSDHVAEVVDLGEVRGFDPEGQAAAFAELSASAAHAAPEREPVTRVVAAPAPDLEPEPQVDEPMPSYAYQDTDTAALLRELSSLGMDDAPPPPPPSRPARPTPPRPVSTVPAKKRKGLFGR